MNKYRIAISPLGIRPVDFVTQDYIIRRPDGAFLCIITGKKQAIKLRNFLNENFL